MKCKCLPYAVCSSAVGIMHLGMYLGRDVQCKFWSAWVCWTSKTNPHALVCLTSRFFLAVARVSKLTPCSHVFDFACEFECENGFCAAFDKIRTTTPALPFNLRFSHRQKSCIVWVLDRMVCISLLGEPCTVIETLINAICVVCCHVSLVALWCYQVANA